MALKKYLACKIKVLEQQTIQLQKKNKAFSKAEYNLEKLLNNRGYLELLNSYFARGLLEGSNWARAAYPRSMKHPENLIHPTIGGLYVRSKSESLIAIALAENNIPFRYENIIVLDDIEFAPDFTILHPRTNKLFYWEHFGMMDDINYTNDFIHKMKYYSKNQIIMGDNLITTFESTTSPLNYTAINHLIQQYLS